MKRLFIVLASVTLLFAQPAFAGETVRVNVNGLVCDFCARAVEKVFGGQAAVETIAVDLSAKLITIGMKDGQTLDDGTITKLVNDSGYALVSIERVEAAGGQDQ
ncbi:MAG: heavy-metal-associated domain-containing protein [Alphaproteobacteria bacterium]|nr:heavy-metal-associated domain-containing protein [Alphaproteobacteria bacterium]